MERPKSITTTEYKNKDMQVDDLEAALVNLALYLTAFPQAKDYHSSLADAIHAGRHNGHALREGLEFVDALRTEDGLPNSSRVRLATLTKELKPFVDGSFEKMENREDFYMRLAEHYSPKPSKLRF